MELEELLARVWEMLMGRSSGPMIFRLILQPVVAVVLAVRAGLEDAREGRPPFLWAVLIQPEERRDALRQGWHDVRTLFVVAIILDVVYELIVFRWIYPGQVLVVAVVLAFVPYALVRGPVTRITSRWLGPKEASPPGAPALHASKRGG